MAVCVWCVHVMGVTCWVMDVDKRSTEMCHVDRLGRLVSCAFGMSGGKDQVMVAFSGMVGIL